MRYLPAFLVIPIDLALILTLPFLVAQLTELRQKRVLKLEEGQTLNQYAKGVHRQIIKHSATVDKLLADIADTENDMSRYVQRVCII